MLPNKFQQTDQGIRRDDFEIIWARNSKEFFFSNTFLIHGKKGLIIDPSANFTYIQKIAAHREIPRVLNSHFHTDHRALNHFFSYAQFLCHHPDAPAISSITKCLEYVDNDPHSPYSRWVRDFSRMMNIQDHYIDFSLKDGDIITAGNIDLKVFHTPGHTPGHIALLVIPFKILITFDIDLTPYGPWYANTVSSIDDFLASIERLKSIRADFYITSHGERLYDPETFYRKLERFERYFFDRDTTILEFLGQNPASLADLNASGIIYKHKLLQDPLKAYFGIKMLAKHLDRLIKINKIQKDDKDLYHIL